MNTVEGLIAHARAIAPTSGAKDSDEYRAAWLSYVAWTRDVASAWDGETDGAVRFFKAMRSEWVFEDDHAGSDLLPAGDCDFETVALANEAWGQVFPGSFAPEQVEPVVAAARLAYLRARMQHILILIGWSEKEEDVVVRHEIEQAIAIELTFDLSDAVSCMTAPLFEPAFIFPSGSAHRLAIWLLGPADEATTTARDQEIGSLMAAAALAWVDAAAMKPEEEGNFGRPLLAMAGQALRAAAGLTGYHESRRDAEQNGRRGGLQRHEKTRALKAWALMEAANERGADMDVARKLALRIPTALANASADPQRLIYQAIRDARSSD